MRSARIAASTAAAPAMRACRSLAIPARAAAALDRRVLFLRLDAAFLRRARRLRRDAPLRHVRRGDDERREPLARVGAVLRLIAEAIRLDHEHAVGREAPVAARKELRARVIGQRARVRDVEAKLDRARDLVDVLPARTRGAHEALD